MIRKSQICNGKEDNMSEKLWKKMETRFLKQLYARNGAAEIGQLQYAMETGDGLPVDLFQTILERLTEKQYCVVEQIKKLDNTEADIVFVTTKGLERLAKKKKVSAKKVFSNHISYELKCAGCETYAEWLEKNRKRLAVENEITRMYARALADIGIIIMYKDNEEKIKETLKNALERTKARRERFPSLHIIDFTVMMAIYTQLQHLVGEDHFLTEVENAKKLIESIMPERHAAAIDFI